MHTTSAAQHPGIGLPNLMRMSRAQLDDLYRASATGSIPEGDTLGTAIVGPGTWYEGLMACIARWFLWQGKVFAPGGAALINKISVLSVQAIRAQVYKGKSWLDGGDSIIIDYSKTSRLARKVRDEVREVAPGVYLGKVYWGLEEDKATRLVDFALVANPKRKPLWISVPRTLTVLLLVLLAAYCYRRFTRDVAVTFADPLEHFKYGSTGGERMSGIPYSIWRALPYAFPQYLPDGGKQFEYASFGFIYEPGKDLPIGVSKRNVQGIDRVFLNCAVCHTGTVRDGPDAPRRIYLGMPANTVNLQAFENFLFRCARSSDFTADGLLAAIDRLGIHEDLINRLLLRYYGIGLLRDRLNVLEGMFTFTQRETGFGPGRFDTFNPPKALLGFPMDKLPQREWAGVVDFPSIWLQGQRQARHMHLHWDGNNDDVRERNRSAAFGTGAFPPTLDRASIARTEAWLLDDSRNVPPPYPYPIDHDIARRGAALYADHCATCHGHDGRDFSGPYVGQVSRINTIATDRGRLDSYTLELCADQNSLYAGYDRLRFKHFRKTYGYANVPLDGIWLRAPYLHNGSVPTLCDLLEPAAKRPKSFYRGYDVYDPARVGFVSELPQENGTRFFKYEAKVEDRDGTVRPVPGNGNEGHEYGTSLSGADKNALVEYLKTF